MTGTQIAGVSVSRETLDRLEAFADLLKKWTQRINLVAPATIPDLWKRHIIDSAQIFSHAPRNACSWVDLGSGGGLPGIVCASLAHEHMPGCFFTLIESDTRKSAFLMTAARTLDLPVTVLPHRAEAVPPQGADIVSARALAPLMQLLPLVERHLDENGVALLPKGKNHAQELEAVQQEWHFDLASHPSLTDPLARLLVIKEIRRA